MSSFFPYLAIDYVRSISMIFACHLFIQTRFLETALANIKMIFHFHIFVWSKQSIRFFVSTAKLRTKFTSIFTTLFFFIRTRILRLKLGVLKFLAI